MESHSQSSESSAESQLELEENTAKSHKQTAIDVIGGIFCNLCHSTFNNKKVFDRHYSEQHNKNIGDIVYTCVVCSKEIAPYPNFRNHCYQAHVKNRFKCQHCNKQFSKQSILNNHIDAVHIFRCSTCQQLFSSKSELHTHQSIHKREKEKPPYPCLHCSKTIHTADMCEMHINEHCTIFYPCPICDETSNSKIETAKHLSIHFNEVLTDEIITTESSGDCAVDMLGGVLCCYCNELFKDRLDFDLHFINEHSDKEIVYSCNICGKQYDKYGLFTNHCRFHVSKNKFECVECGKFFPRLSLLVLHTEAFHTTGIADNKPFTCMECGHAFGSESRLREHLRVVHNINVFTCSENGCDMMFETPRELILHQRKHQEYRDNCCRQCGLHFTTLSSCHLHLDVHRKKHYSCPVCNKQYREKYFIMKHIPTHFESVLHVCKVCGKVFNARSRLVEHTKTHSEIRKHKCSYCGKGFVKPFLLEQHLNIHTGFRPYKCVVCSKTFASYPNWMKHLHKIHNLDKPTLKKLAEDSKTTPKNNLPADVNNKNVDKSDSDGKCESEVDSISPDMSLDTYMFGESDDSTVDSIDPAVILKDWCSLNENSFVENSLQYTDMLPVNNITFDSEIKLTPMEHSTVQPSTVLPEYGPELIGDDHYLPHIDPLLTIKPQPSDIPVPQQSWEPYINKVYHDYDTDDVNKLLSFINTDIY